MPQNAFFQWTPDLLIRPKMMQRHFLFTLHPISMVIFATATVLAFVLLRNSNFNFHCYTQCEATPTHKLARKCAATSRDFFRERLQSAFTWANQLRWIAQYTMLWLFSLYTIHAKIKSYYISILPFPIQAHHEENECSFWRTKLASADQYSFMVQSHSSWQAFVLSGNVTLRFTEDGSSSLDLDAQAIEYDESLKVMVDNKGKGENIPCGFVVSFVC